MFKNETKNAMMAFAVVAMFMLSAFGVMLSTTDAALSDENAGGTYNIHMRVGDSFEYQPDANITGTTFSWATSPSKPSGMSYNESAAVAGTTTKLSYTPTSAGETTVTLTASVTTGSYTQTATQTIVFHVYNKLVITKGSDDITGTHTAGSDATFSASLKQGITSAKTYSFTLGGNADAAWSNYVVDNANKGVSVDVSGKVLTVTAATTVQAGTYKITADAGWTKTTAGDNVNTNTASEDRNFTFNLTVAEGFQITNEAAQNTVIGMTTDGANTLQITTDAATKDTTVTGYTLTAGTLSGISNYAPSINSTTGLVTYPTGTGISNALFASDDTQSATVKFTVAVAGTLDGSGAAPVSTSKEFTLTVYRELKFTTTPNINTNNTGVYMSSNNGLDVLMATTIDGAKKVSYNWGDGTETTKVNNSASANYFTANHTYAKAGTYFITVTAENDFGEASYITPYTTGAAIVMDADKTLKMTGIKETVDDTAKTIVLDPTVIVTAGYAVAYKWTYSVDGAEAVELTAAGTPAWFKAFGGADHKSITISTAQADELPANVKFTCEASVTFEGDEKATTSSASYTYQDSHFMAQNGWIVWVALAALIVGIVLIVFVTGPIMPVNIFTVAAAVITVILFLAKMYMWF